MPTAKFGYFLKDGSDVPSVTTVTSRFKESEGILGIRAYYTIEHNIVYCISVPRQKQRHRRWDDHRILAAFFQKLSPGTDFVVCASIRDVFLLVVHAVLPRHIQPDHRHLTLIA